MAERKRTREMPGQLTAFPDLDGEQLDRAEALAGWWRDHAESEIKMVVAKAIEYGASDLKVMGEAMVLLMPKVVVAEMGRDERERVGQEMAVTFYALGKVARLLGAFEQGRLPSMDTWLDLGIYSRMGQRIREAGEWG